MILTPGFITQRELVQYRLRNKPRAEKDRLDTFLFCSDAKKVAPYTESQLSHFGTPGRFASAQRHEHTCRQPQPRRRHR